MATKVKPCRIKATGTPQAGYVPKYVDEDTFQWGTGGGGSDIEYVTQAEYNALLPGALTDGKHYFIYTPSVVPPTPWTPGVNTLVYYTFDNTLSDSSGNNNDATYYFGTPITYSTGLVGDSAVFGPTILTTPLNTTLFNSEFTVSFCVYITAIHSSNVIRMRGGQTGYTSIQYEGGEGGLQWYDANMGRTSWSWTPTLNTWHHIVITGDGVLPLVCYINGNVVSASNYNYTYSNSSRTLWLGNNESVSDALGLQGRFDEFIIEDKARTASDVANYREYNLGL